MTLFNSFIHSCEDGYEKLSGDLTQALSEDSIAGEEQIETAVNHLMNQFIENLEANEEAKNNFVNIRIEDWHDQVLDPLLDVAKKHFDQILDKVQFSANELANQIQIYEKKKQLLLDYQENYNQKLKEYIDGKLASREYSSLEIDEADLFPDRKKIIEELKIYVDTICLQTPFPQKSNQQLQSQIDKINAKTLYGSTENLIDYYKNKIAYAIKKDKLLNELKNSQFQKKILTAINARNQLIESRKAEKKESELKERVKALTWENRILNAVDVVSLARSEKKEDAGLNIDVYQEIARLKVDILALQEKHKQLQFNIQAEKQTCQENQMKLESQQKRVDNCFTQTLKTEENLRKHRALCLQRIKELQEEIDQDIEKIKLEPERLNIAFEEMNDKFIEKIKTIWENYKLNQQEIFKKQKIAHAEQIKNYSTKLKKEATDFKTRQERIRKKYQEADEKKCERFDQKHKELLNKFNDTVILNRKKFAEDWNKNNTEAYEEKKKQGKAVNKALENYFDEPREEINREIDVINELLINSQENIRLKANENQESFRIKYNLNIGALNREINASLESQRKLNEEIEKKMESLLGAKK